MQEFLLKIKIYTATKSIIVWGGLKSVGKAFKRESDETRAASKILMKMVKGKEVTHEEIKFLKNWKNIFVDGECKNIIFEHF